MSMLAERKRKQKWSLNPRGNTWAQDTNKFGQKLLEKMGWKEGKGLGAREDGLKEHIKVNYKNDSQGFGFKDTDGWTVHEDNFSTLLQNLSGSEVAVKVEQKNADEKPRSLEKKSQSSRVRVHYHKFTRGKDISRYSEKDLASIFGKKTPKKGNDKEQFEEIKTEIKIETEEKKNNSGVQIIEGGSMVEYFKSKLSVFKKTSESKESEDNSCHEFARPGFGFGSNFNGIKKEINENLEFIPQTNSSFCFESENESFQNENSEIQKEETKIEKKKTKKRKLEEISETPKKKNKERIDDVLEESSKRKKKKGNEKKEFGLSNPAFDPMFSKEISIERHSLNTIKEDDEEKEEIPRDKDFNLTEKQLKKKRKNEIEINDQIETSKRRKKEKTEKGAFANPIFESPNNSLDNLEQNDNNTYEIKIKKKKKNKKNSWIENPVLDDLPLKNIGLDNPTFDENAPENPENPSEKFEVKKKSKKNNNKLKGIENPSLNLASPENTIIEEPQETSNVVPKEDNSQNSTTSPSNFILNVSDEPDIMLNVSIGPPSYLKQKNETTIENKKEKIRKCSGKWRKNVRFSDVTDEREIPNRLDSSYYSTANDKEKNDLFEINSKVFEESLKEDDMVDKLLQNGLVNEGFDFRKDRLENKMQMMAERFEEFKAEIENDINEGKNLKVEHNMMESISIGEGVGEGENEKLEHGTKLLLKYSDFGQTPYYMKNYSAFHAKKSYKHLIKGDIVVHFKNTNLHEIHGYGKQFKKQPM